MISALRKVPQPILLLMNGIAFYLSMLSYIFSIAGAMAAMQGLGFVSILVWSSVFMVVLASLLAKFLVYVTYRISGGIFIRKSGLLYPFPIHYPEFTETVLSFSFICLILCALVELPVFFLPTLSQVLGAVRSLVMWIFLFLGARYLVRTYGHDYDKKSLAIALSVIPFVLVGVTLALTIWEVAA